MLRVLGAVVGNDIHAVANKLIFRQLNSENFDCWNLGVSVKPREIGDAFAEFDPHLTLISSLNGEAYYWCEDLIKKINKFRDLSQLVYIGGNLSAFGLNRHEIVQRLVNSGYSRVFAQNASIADLLDAVAEDFSLVLV